MASKACIAKRMRLGLCRCCGRPRDTAHTTCSACAARAAPRRRINARNRISSGTCLRCGVPATAGQCCEKHWVYVIANNALRHCKLWKEALALLELQDRKCAYSGEPLIAGVNASLDHKTPRSRGGADTLENLQWVTKQINRMKTDMTDEEFRTMCRLIAAKPIASSYRDGKHCLPVSAQGQSCLL